MPPSEFDEFRSTLSRKRDFRALLFPFLNDAESFPFRESVWTPRLSGLRELKNPWRGTLLIEDADIECILALDAEYGLDPQFIVSYVGRSYALDRWDTSFGHPTCPKDASIVRNWYLTSGTTFGPFSRRWHNPSRTARRGMPKFFDRGEATNGKRPWWGEACRQICHEEFREGEHFFVDSKIACYCLSDDLRKLRL